jgi:hypothetical protein
MSLPRQTYLRAGDSEREQRLAEAFAAATRHQQLKIGIDDPKKMKPRIDRVLHKDGRVMCFFEVKQCSRRFGEGEGWTTGQRKTKTLRNLYSVVYTPVLYLVEFADGTVASVNVMRDYVEVPGFGRFDRGDAADIEGGTMYRWRDFKVITRTK